MQIQCPKYRSLWFGTSYLALVVTGFLLTLTLSASAETQSPPEITEQEALQIGQKQLVTARPDLDVKDPVPGNRFVPAGPGSGGGPKWVIGFETVDKKSGHKWIYYITVFPDGRTSEKEIRPGASTGTAAKDDR